MPLTVRQQQVLSRYFAEQSSGGQPETIQWLLDFFVLSKTQQLQAVRDWIDTKSAANDAQRLGLASRKSEAEAAIDADNTLLSEVRAAL